MPVRFPFIRKYALFSFALTVLSVASLPAQTVAPSRAEIFEQVWTIINEKYYDAGLNGVDWKSVKKKYRPQVQTAAGERDFYALLDRMAGELRDSHTRVYSPAQAAERKKQKRASVGITIREISGAPVIASVEADSEAARAGVVPGMIVHTIGGQPVGQAIAEARAAIGVSSSERATAMRVFSRILTGEPETVLNLELADARGTLRRFALVRRTVSAKPSVTARILPSGVAYLKFGKFDEELEKEVSSALESLKNAPALILDLRANGGGDGEVGLRFAGAFFDRSITVARIVTRTGKPPLPGIPMTLETGAENAQIFSRPVVILIDEATASTSELITNAFQEQKRAAVFGTNSCGCVLAFLDYKPLKGGGDLTLSEFGFISARGKRLEGSGVTPDQLVPLELQDIRAGRDRALEEAEKYLGKVTGS